MTNLIKIVILTKAATLLKISTLLFLTGACIEAPVDAADEQASRQSAAEDCLRMKPEIFYKKDTDIRFSSTSTNFYGNQKNIASLIEGLGYSVEIDESEITDSLSQGLKIIRPTETDFLLVKDRVISHLNLAHGGGSHIMIVPAVDSYMEEIICASSYD